jgi:hypothetical protein
MIQGSLTRQLGLSNGILVRVVPIEGSFAEPHSYFWGEDSTGVLMPWSPFGVGLRRSHDCLGTRDERNTILRVPSPNCPTRRMHPGEDGGL